ncbi:MAG: elongation factor G [Treponema sp.]|nr:elongation factor G [Treponema sp.]
MDFETKNVRNVAIAGHGQTGKTTLLEHLLFAGKMISKPAFTDSGKTVSDSSPEEIARHISIYASLAHIPCNNAIINIWDTPGSADFIGEVISAFRSSECAVMLLDSRTGTQVETAKLWRELDRRGKPRLLFINRLDDSRSNFSAASQGVHDEFNVEITPITIPMGSGSSYKGVIDVLHKKAYFKSDKEDELETEGAIPEEYKEAYEQAHNVLLGSAAEGDDDLLVKFIDEGELTDEEVVLGIKNAFADNKIVPCFAGDPLHNSGLTSLLQFIADLGPSPLQRLETTVTANGDPATVKIQPENPVSAFIVKTAGDQFSGKLSYMKVVTGTLQAESELNNINQGKKEKINKLYRCIGKKLIEVSSVQAGDICIATKLATAKTSDTLAADVNALPYKPLRSPEPVYSVAIFSDDKKKEAKISDILFKSTETDRTITYVYNSETRQNVLSGMGELHLAILLDRIKTENNIEVQTAVPRIAYRETIQRKAEAEYTHKKQSGGHGQYAKVVLSVEPLARGDNYKFTNAVFGGAIPKNYIPGVEKGVKQSMEHGVLAGYPVVDIAVTVLDGKDHPVDSSDLAFQIAARNALADAMRNASAILLEPIMNVSILAETKYLGDIMSDVSSRRGRILGQNAIGNGIEEIKAQIPQAELLRYAIDLRSITSSTGSFETSFDHYDPVTGKLAETIIAKAKEIQKEEAAKQQ